MTFNNYIEVSYVNNDPTSPFYNPIPTASASDGDACKDLSTGEWYIYDGNAAEWVLSFIEVTPASACQLIDVRFIVDSSVLFDGVSAQLLDMRYATSDTVIANDVSAALVNDRIGVVRSIKR